MCDSAVYMHGCGTIDLGTVGTHLWPFKPLVDFIIDKKNISFIQKCIDNWLLAKNAYSQKNRQDQMYYLANASGSPPKIAKERDAWPNKKSISDSKTSAGMDRTDDIKKGIYQSLKIGSQVKNNSNIKTAIISNLPAYRHGEAYVEPFINMLWGLESDLILSNGKKVLYEDKLRRAFDFIITLEKPILREIAL